MLKDFPVTATIAVRNLDKSRRFYEDRLGLDPVSVEKGGAVTYKAGSSDLLVYQSAYAGGYDATTATWSVGKQLEPLVESLRGRGVEFEHYDFPGLALEGDIHTNGTMKMAWFRDPDGNVIGVVGT